MSTPQRISRGFHRLGLLLAVLWLLINLGMGLVEEQLVSFAIMGLISGAIIYAIVRAIGWVVGGFMSS